MFILQVVILAIVQGLAELLPVSSSAHVVVAEKLMGLDPSSPQMTLLLVMLHTGTMFAVILYFWRQWREAFFYSAQAFWRFFWMLILATAITGVVGEALIKAIEMFWFRGQPNAEVEQLFSHLELIAPALALAGVLIIAAGIYERRHSTDVRVGKENNLDAKQAGIIGAVQGLCLPFRGFSRSGATISTGMLVGVTKARAEEFSFALAVALTPAADGRELLRLMKAQHIALASAGGGMNLASALVPGALGAVFAFLAGLLALKWLSRWLQGGRWHLFGIYCLFAAGVVGYLHHLGY
jgi:undecaprenyl-diphosphatase